MSMMPPEISPEDEIKVSWKNTDDHTKISAALGGAKITIRVTDESVNIIPWLLAAMPGILTFAYDAMDKEVEA